MPPRILLSTCVAVLAPITLGSVACAGEPFTSSEGDAGAGATNAGATNAGGAANAGATNTGGATNPGGANAGGTTSAGASGVSGAGATGGPSGEEITLDLRVASDSDDATWALGSDERLRFGLTEANVEVGADEDDARSGFRFELPVPPGARIESAVLYLMRVAGAADDNDTMFVKIYDAAHVEPFDELHVHGPEGHAPGGFWPPVVAGFRAGSTEDIAESPDLSMLVQHVVDRADWRDGNAIGFVLFPEEMSTWTAYSDSSAGSGNARLRVVYRAP